MLDTTTLPDTNITSTINRITDIIDLTDCTWIQRLLINIYLKDIQEMGYQEGT